MSTRSSPVPLPHGPPRVFRTFEGLVERAVQHAQDRLFTACEAIALIGSLALQWDRPYAPRLSMRRAGVQDGSAGAGEQAAHMLPGQLLIDGKQPWALARGDRLIAALLARFEVTAAVPTPFNSADSAAERAGLKSAFLRACERAWSRVAAGERDLIPTYEEFLADATRAFEKAELTKDDKRLAAERKGDARASVERSVESSFLRMYKGHGVTAEEANRRYPLRPFRS